jgi:hypothetical protein
MLPQAEAAPNAVARVSRVNDNYLGVAGIGPQPIPQYSALSLFAQLRENNALARSFKKRGFLLYEYSLLLWSLGNRLDSCNIILTFFSLPVLRTVRYNGTVAWVGSTTPAVLSEIGFANHEDRAVVAAKASSRVVFLRPCEEIARIN